MADEATDRTVDVAVVGSGAAGLATAIFAARCMPGRSVVALDAAARPGAKILVSGGGRCNVTNAVVTPEDFRGGSRHVIRKVLAVLPVARTVEFFREIGVELHQEEHGKLFPDTNRARTVLDALLNEVGRADVRILSGARVTAVERDGEGFHVTTAKGDMTARRVVLATGGLSLPKTGSDGTGYSLARHLGHSLIPTTPALVPLILDGDFHTPLSGISHEVEIVVAAEGRKPERRRGSLLWTHFGVSGPVALDASGTWHRVRLEGRAVHVTASLLPGNDFGSAERELLEAASAQPKLRLRNALAAWLPARVAEAVLAKLDIEGQVPLAHLPRETRRRLIHALLAWPLPVRDSRGYGHAEVTAGGVPLDEIDPATMASRKCPGLYLVGEILDVDGRIGGFNFQWAWSSAFAAARGLSGK